MGDFNYCFDGTAQYVIYSAHDLSKTFGMPFLPKEIFFLVLYGMQETPMHNYILSKGVSEEKFEKIRYDNFKKISIRKGTIICEFYLDDDLMVIDSEIINIFDKSKEIAKEEYNSDVIKIEHLTGAFAELYNDIFLYFSLIYV